MPAYRALRPQAFGWLIDKNMRIIVLTLIVIPFILGCASKPVQTPTDTGIKALTTVETLLYTPTVDGLAFRSTERAGTVYALQTASITPLPTRPATQTSTPILTSTLNPTSPLISFTRYPNDGADEITSCLHGLGTYRFALYQDGRVILFDNGHYLATSVSASEIEKLMEKIEATGFLSINGYDNQYVSDAPTPSYTGGWGSSIAVRGHHISIEDARQDYLVSPVLQVLDIITGYRPSGLKPYQPDRMTVWAFQNTSSDSYIPTPVPPILNWSSENIRVEQFTDGPHVVSGSALSFLYGEIRDIPALRMVRQEHQDYLVLVCPAFDENQ